MSVPIISNTNPIKACYVSEIISSINKQTKMKFVQYSAVLALLFAGALSAPLR